MYDYDRSKTAAAFDLHGEWHKIVQALQHQKARDFLALLKKAAPYANTIGMELDVQKSWLDMELKGSDGPQLVGELVLTEKEENSTGAADARSAAKWATQAFDVYGRAELIKTGPGKNRGGEPIKTWRIDLGE